MADERPTIASFFTGVYHSGENLRRLLAQRREELAPPVRMCDGLSHSMPKDLQTIVANCLNHGRRKFVDVAEAFPEEVRYVLQCLKEVYRTDAAAKRFKLSADQRLQLHQRRSEPILDELHRWLTERLEQRRVEPDSSLGQAIKYLLRQWDKLTLFLRKPGVPLDYLTQVQRHEQQVKADPARWLPWNYREHLATQ